MTDNDRSLILRAESFVWRGQDEQIDLLIPLADSSETRRRLEDLSWQAFKNRETRTFDL